MIIEFHTRQQKFNSWLKEVFVKNFYKKDVKSALCIWEVPPTKKGFQAMHCRYNCDLNQLKWFHKELGEFIKELEFDKYLRENIDKYIELL